MNGAGEAQDVECRRPRRGSFPALQRLVRKVPIQGLSTNIIAKVMRMLSAVPLLNPYTSVDMALPRDRRNRKGFSPHDEPDGYGPEIPVPEDELRSVSTLRPPVTIRPRPLHHGRKALFSGGVLDKSPDEENDPERKDTHGDNS